MCRTLLTILFVSFLYPAAAQQATDTFSLFFDLNVPKLNKITEKKIDLLLYNDKIIIGSSIMIVGYADYLGSEGYNKALSMERAKNVKEYLVKYGIEPNDVKLCVGEGKIDREGMTDRSGSPIDRRVDIVVNNRRKKIARTKKDTVKKHSAGIDEITNMKAGSTLLLKNVYFPPDRHVILPESKETLEKLYITLRDNPTIRISIEGHVCCVKDAPDAWDIDTYEPTLSVNRAKAIYNYLVERGIDPKRLQYAGFGRSRPVVADERSEEDAEKNRRVEIRIIGK